MGMSQSNTRKITLVDDEKAGVIKLSESLAHRLRGQIEGQQAAAAAQKASPAAAQEPLHSAPDPPPPPPSHAPLPSPPPSFIEKPLPIAPEPPKILDVAPKVPDVTPVPEASKVPKVTPITVVAEPVLEPSEPSSSSSDGFPREVISEPLVPEPPPPSPGESLPASDSVDVNPSLPLVAETATDETSLADQLLPVETIQSTPDDTSQISEPKESVVTEVFESTIPASAFLADLAVSTPAPVVEETSVVADAPALEPAAEETSVTPVVEETFVVADAPALEPVVEETSVAVDAPALEPVVVEETSVAPVVVEETSVVADVAAAVAGSILEVHLPPPETLLTAAFASDAIETAAASSSAPAGGEVTVTGTAAVPVPQLIEEAPAVPSSETEAPAVPDVGVAIKAGPSPTLAQPAGNIPPWSIYAEEAHLMVMRLREEKDQEIKKLNQDWRDKMDSRETEFVKMARLSEEQVASALKEVESLFMKASCSPVCQNQQEAVMNCYQDHPRQSLRCAREVEHFTQCVDLSRLQSIMKQEAH